MKYYLILLSICISVSASAQLHKRFLDKKGNVTIDSTKADTYVLYQKIEQDSSYLWFAAKFYMNGIPIEKGSYLDEELTIKHGKFVCYQTKIVQTKIDEHHSSIDTGAYISKTCFYNNGHRDGVSVDYFLNGKKKSLRTYESGQMSGLYEDYYDTGELCSRGNCINGKLEGDFYAFRTDSTVARYIKYRGGTPVKEINYNKDERMYAASPGYNFYAYLLRCLRKPGLPPAHGQVIIDLIVEADGKLVNPKLEIGVSPAFDEALINAIDNCPNWLPATLNGKKIRENLTMVFEYDTSKFL